MLYDMSRGPSGRIVVELDPNLKSELYLELTREGTTFKDWLIQRASTYIDQRRQPLLLVAEDSIPYGESR